MATQLLVGPHAPGSGKNAIVFADSVTVRPPQVLGCHVLSRLFPMGKSGTGIQRSLRRHQRPEVEQLGEGDRTSRAPLQRAVVAECS
jgi:hypothetical protein